MNFEPDSIILPRLIPWLEKSRLRMTIFGIIFFIAGATFIFIWLTHFFIPIFAWSTIFGLLFIYIALTQLDGDKKDNSLKIIKAADRSEQVGEYRYYQVQRIAGISDLLQRKFVQEEETCLPPKR